MSGTIPDVMSRISGRLGRTIDLNNTFFRNGVPEDPFAVRLIQIYKSAVQPENLVAEFPILSPFDTGYPAPLEREDDGSGGIKPGVFHLFWDVPTSGIVVPDIFFDVWSFLPTDPTGTAGSTGVTGVTSVTGTSILDDESLWRRCCNEFWLFPDGFECDSGLSTIRFSFEPLDLKLHKPEIRTIEVGLMPQPLYDFDYNRIAPIIPQLRAFVTVKTHNCETIIDDEPMKIGLRQGTFRSNPFVLQYLLDTTRIPLVGSYQYRIRVCLPNGETRVSPDFILQVS